MFKKIISIVLALMVLVSMSAIATSVSAADNKLYFEVPSDWKNFKSVFCHIWVYNGDSLASWQSKKEKCVDEGNGIYSYDLSKVGGLTAGEYYGVIFSLDIGAQTYNTILTTACIGDTLYCNDTIYENPADSSKTCRAAFWKGQNPAQYGPVMLITSIGNLIGTCLPPGVTATDLFNTFLTGNLENARTYSGKNDQAIIDDMANGLGLSQAQVKELIDASELKIDWKMEESKAPTVEKPIQSGNTGAVSSGQEMTVVFIALATMIAAAGVILVARKKVNG